MAGEAPRAPAAPTVRLLIVDDHDLARAGLRSLLAGEPGLEVVGEAVDGQQALALCRRLRPDLVLMDVRLPGLDGLAATRAIKEAAPATKVVMVTMHESVDYLVQALEVGADGYVLKGATRAELLAALRRVLAGQGGHDPTLLVQALRRNGDANGSTDGAALRLSERELDVLRLVARGLTNQEIARELVLSRSTVKTHLEHILAKLTVADRTHAAVRAAELGLLSPHGM